MFPICSFANVCIIETAEHFAVSDERGTFRRAYFIVGHYPKNRHCPAKGDVWSFYAKDSSAYSLFCMKNSSGLAMFFGEENIFWKIIVVSSTVNMIIMNGKCGEYGESSKHEEFGERDEYCERG